MTDKRHQSQQGLRWRMYEAMKRKWLKDHPHASPLEYHRAMHEIAKRCGTEVK